MVKHDDVKPISSSYDFGDDWLGDLGGALDFDEGGGHLESERTGRTLEQSPEGASLPIDLDIDNHELSRKPVKTSESCEIEDIPISLSEEESSEKQASFGTSEKFVKIGTTAVKTVPDFAISNSAWSPGSAEFRGMMEDILGDISASLTENGFFGAPLADLLPSSGLESSGYAESSEDLSEGDETGEDEFELDIDDTELEKSESGVKGEAVGRSFVAQTLSISALQKEAERHQSVTDVSHSDDDPLRDSQLWQFVSLIALRLFDDLELFIVQKCLQECCDIVKQLNRLSNILAFGGMSELLPVFAYIGTILPVSFSEEEIGVEPVRGYDESKLDAFYARSGEFLNCLVYILTYMAKRSVGFDTGRFTDSLETLYRTLEVEPGRPSSDAPLAITDGSNPLELTTRTVSKIARTLEALVTESLHYIESSVFYGYESGLHDACKSLNSATQIVREYKLGDFEAVFIRQYLLLRECRFPNVPPQEFFECYEAVCCLFEQHFSKNISARKIAGLRALLSRFLRTSEPENGADFGIRWKSFVEAALPVLEAESGTARGQRQRLSNLWELSEKYEITWLKDVFERFDVLWDEHSETCAEAFEYLVSDLRGFPVENIEQSDLEQLGQDRINLLLSRQPGAKPESPYSLLMKVQEISNRLQSQIEHPGEISWAVLYDVLIDARQCNCPSVARAFEVLLSLVEKIPQDASCGGNEEVSVDESVVDALCFMSGYLEALCQFLIENIECDQQTKTVNSDHAFYRVLLSMYQTPGQPRDGVTWFVLRRLNAIMTEVQLVWGNVSTPTSREYYCGLLRELLDLSTICEMTEVQSLLENHLMEIPEQPFVDAENRKLARQCACIARALEEYSPRLIALPNVEQVKSFFSKTISALNQLLSSEDANTPEALSCEISRIHERMSSTGLVTDFPPVIAILFELRHLCLKESVTRDDLESRLYEITGIANNVCPEWSQPKEAELEFVRTSLSLPMPFFQDMLECVCSAYESMKPYLQKEPAAWEKISHLYESVNGLVTYLPNVLENVCQNAQNRCRYLKKKIYVELQMEGYPSPSEMPQDMIRPMMAMAFSSVVERLVELIIDNAFVQTDMTSRIIMELHPLANEYSLSIVHTGERFSHEEMLSELLRVNIVPAGDENVFELLVGSEELRRTYPPVNGLSYILPIIRQFDGHLEVGRDVQERVVFHIGFNV